MAEKTEAVKVPAGVVAPKGFKLVPFGKKGTATIKDKKTVLATYSPVFKAIPDTRPAFDAYFASIKVRKLGDGTVLSPVESFAYGKISHALEQYRGDERDRLKEGATPSQKRFQNALLAVTKLASGRKPKISREEAKSRIKEGMTPEEILDALGI